MLLAHSNKMVQIRIILDSKRDGTELQLGFTCLNYTFVTGLHTMIDIACWNSSFQLFTGDIP